MTHDGLPQNLTELLRFIKTASIQYKLRPGSPKDPIAFMNKLGIPVWLADDIIKSLKEEECRSKYEGEPCDDPEIHSEVMWRFIHHYQPYDMDPCEIFIKVAPCITIMENGKTTMNILIAISFHESEA